MKKIHLGANFAVFLLFFGVAMLEAFKSGNGLKVLFWSAIGIVFLLSDDVKKEG
jgi:hypothetical protein